MKHMLHNGLLGLLAGGSLLYAIDSLKNPAPGANVIRSHIQAYKKDKHHDFIAVLLALDPHNFPDADMVSDLDSDFVEISVPLENGQVATCIFKQKIFVCCRGAEPIGFVRIFSMPEAHGGMIVQMAVKKNARRMGAGRQLLNHAIECLKSQGIQEITVESKADNKGAHALYENVGFEKILELPDSYLYRMQL